MIENLKNHYKDSFITSDSPIHNEKYTWFLNESGSFFGINKESITKEEEELLSSLFTRIDNQQSDMNETQASWHHFLYLNDSPLPSNHLSYTKCRFIFFQTNRPVTDKLEFQQAVQSLLPFDIVTLWENEVNGVFIQMDHDEMAESISYHEIVDTLTSDFYADIHLFRGQSYHIDNELPKAFLWEKECFQKAIQYLRKQRVSRIDDVVPYFLLEKMDPCLRDQLRSSLFQGLEDDKELIDTVKAFLESDLNVSTASKKLYMHRNSLQYRIDKFIEKTGVDIKHFQGAVATYLAILSLEYFSDS